MLDIKTMTRMVDRKRDEINKNVLVVNLFGGPCSGKSTLAMLLTANLKRRGIRAEYVAEVAKEYVYLGSLQMLDGSINSQFKLLLEQIKAINIPLNSGDVDVLVVDSPLLLNSFYVTDKEFTEKEEFFKMCKSLHKAYNSISFFVERDGKFSPSGRVHKTLKQCMAKDKEIKSALEKFNLEHKICSMEDIDTSMDVILDEIVKASKSEVKTKPKKSSKPEGIKVPSWKITDMTDYIPITDFYKRLVEAEAMGAKTVNVTFDRIYRSLQGDFTKVAEMTELAMVLYDRACNSRLKTGYLKKYREVCSYVHQKYNKKNLKYFDTLTGGLI